MAKRTDTCPRCQTRSTIPAKMIGANTIISPAQNMLNESTSSLIGSGFSIIGGETG